MNKMHFRNQSANSINLTFEYLLKLISKVYYMGAKTIAIEQTHNSLNPSFEGKKATSKSFIVTFPLEKMLVDEELVASELSTADIELDETSSRHASSDESDSSCCQSCEDSDCSSGCSCGYKGESGEDEASEIEDDYTETFKSLSLKGKSVSDPAKDKPTGNANIPKKESLSENTPNETQIKKEIVESSVCEKTTGDKVVKSSEGCNGRKCCSTKEVCSTQVKCCKTSNCNNQRQSHSDDECCSTPKNLKEEKIPQAPAPTGRSCCIM